MSVVCYKLRDDLLGLIVCLYDPHGEPEAQFTTDNIYNFVTDCAWQIQHGERVRRIPFCLTPSLAEAEREIESMRKELQCKRKSSGSQPPNKWTLKRK